MEFSNEKFGLFIICLAMVAATSTLMFTVHCIKETVQQSNQLKAKMVQDIMDAPEQVGTNKAQLIRTTFARYSGLHE